MYVYCTSISINFYNINIRLQDYSVSTPTGTLLKALLISNNFYFLPSNSLATLLSHVHQSSLFLGVRCDGHILVFLCHILIPPSPHSSIMVVFMCSISCSGHSVHNHLMGDSLQVVRPA